MSDTRLIMYHKHHTSARLRFLKFSYGGVCAFDPLPSLSQMLHDDREESVVNHPASYISDAVQRLGMATGDLEVDREFKAFVDVPDGVVQVFLVRFTGIDPPFETAKAHGGEFVDLTQARNVTQVELELLRMAYETVMTG